MNINPKITVVTVCYNTVRSIEKTILSVINQIYPNIEYIIIDGGSTDGTVDIIKKYSDKIAFWVSEPDGGIYDAMNKGIKAATGEWINFMNAGDCFVDKYVIQKVFENHIPQIFGVVFGNSQELRDNILYSVKPLPFYESKKHNRSKGICHQSIFTKTLLAKKYLFDKSFPICADFAMMYYLYYKEKTKFIYFDIDIAYYDITGTSNNKKKVGEIYYEEVRLSNPDKYLFKKLIMLQAYIRIFFKKFIIFLLKTFSPKLLQKIRLRNKTIIE
jgi:glycosyltransferase involved in cell wall biosynthesis